MTTDDPLFVDPWASANWAYMRSKLVAVGATEDEVADFEEQWLHDRNWPHEDKVRIMAMGDGRLRQELLRTRADNDRDSMTDEERADRARRQAERAAALELHGAAEQASAWEPDHIMGWVGDNPARARAMISVEEKHPSPRAGLLAGLIAVIERAQ